MKAQNNQKHLPPNLTNFLNSFREIGYLCEVAIADIIDNCVSAKSSLIKITAVENPDRKIYICDNGYGMTELELEEAMRLSSKNPNDIREKSDLGRFGLGLKVASFSQCKKLTVQLIWCHRNGSTANFSRMRFFCMDSTNSLPFSDSF